MKRFQQFINDETKAALEELSRSKIQSLMSPWSELEYGQSTLLVQNVSIRIAPKKFIIIENDWTDTPKEAHDYYFLEAKIENKPSRIKVKDEGNEHYTYFGDHTTLRLGSLDAVKSVSILTDTYEGAAESVEYDAGVLIELESGKNFSIIRQQSISGFLEINHTNPLEEISDLSVRLVI